MNKFTALLSLFLLQACASSFTQYDYLKKQNIPKPAQHEFPHCYRYGCDKITTVNFTESDWHKIETIFKNQSAAQERSSIAKSIGAFERIVGAKTGTKADIHGTFKASGPYQQDCIDESTNTTIYLSILDQRELLKHHTVRAPETRLPLIHAGTWPHRTALIQEKQSQKLYAVDSWFHDNGVPAEVIPLKQWKKGWTVEENLSLDSALKSHE